MNKKLKNKKEHMIQRNARFSHKSKGITLIALIITIIVLLILAVVAIREVMGEGIIAHALKARDGQEEGRLKEKITLGMQDYYIEHEGLFNRDEFIENVENYVEGATGDVANKTVTLENKTFTVEEDRTLTLVEAPKAGIEIYYADKKVDKIDIFNGRPIASISLKANLINIGGTINWEISNDECFTLSKATGDSVIIKTTDDYYGGETLVTATCGEYSTSCTIKVFGKSDEIYYDADAGATELQYKSLAADNGVEDQIFELHDQNGEIFGKDDEENILFKVRVGKFKMKDKNAYINGINELNNICKLYGQGKGVAYSRSIKIEDEIKGIGEDTYSLKLSEDGQTISLGTDAVVRRRI